MRTETGAWSLGLRMFRRSPTVLANMLSSPGSGLATFAHYVLAADRDKHAVGDVTHRAAPLIKLQVPEEPMLEAQSHCIGLWQELKPTHVDVATVAVDQVQSPKTKQSDRPNPAVKRATTLNKRRCPSTVAAGAGWRLDKTTRSSESINTSALEATRTPLQPNLSQARTCDEAAVPGMRSARRSTGRPVMSR